MTLNIDMLKQNYKYVVDKINGFSNTINDKINFLFFFILSIIKTNLSSFIKFLLEKNIIQMGIGFIIATQVKTFIDNITHYLLNPIVTKIVPRENTPESNLQKNIFGINFNYGQIIIEFLTFMLMIVLVYFIWQATKIDWAFIDPTLNNLLQGKNVHVAIGV